MNALDFESAARAGIMEAIQRDFVSDPVETGLGEDRVAICAARERLREAESVLKDYKRRSRSEVAKRTIEVEERRQDLGKLLIEARKRWPASGPNARGWGEFLREFGVRIRTAQRCMKVAGYEQEEIHDTESGVSRNPAGAARSVEIDRCITFTNKVQKRVFQFSGQSSLHDAKTILAQRLEAIAKELREQEAATPARDEPDAVTPEEQAHYEARARDLFEEPGKPRTSAKAPTRVKREPQSETAQPPPAQ